MEHIFFSTVCSIQTFAVWNSLSSSALPLQQVAKAETRQHMVKRMERQVRATSHPEQPSMKRRYYRKTPLASAVESRTGRTKRVGFSSPTGIPEAVQGLHRYVEGGRVEVRGWDKVTEEMLFSLQSGTWDSHWEAIGGLKYKDCWKYDVITDALLHLLPDPGSSCLPSESYFKISGKRTSSNRGDLNRIDLLFLNMKRPISWQNLGSLCGQRRCQRRDTKPGTREC